MAKAKATKKAKAKKKAGKGKAKAAPAAPAAPLSASELLSSQMGGAAPRKKKASSSKGKPAVTVDQGLVDLFLRGAKKAKEGAADKKAALGERGTGKLRDLMERARIEVSRRLGRLEKSVEANGAVSLTQPHAYLDVDAETEGELREVFGDELYSEFFRPTAVVKLNMDLLDARPELTAALYAAIGQVAADHEVAFDVLLDIKQKLKPTEELTRRRVLETEIEEVFEAAVSAGILEPKAPTIK
jgi:hypothetical protein